MEDAISVFIRFICTVVKEQHEADGGHGITATALIRLLPAVVMGGMGMFGLQNIRLSGLGAIMGSLLAHPDGMDRAFRDMTAEEREHVYNAFVHIRDAMRDADGDDHPDPG